MRVIRKLIFVTMVLIMSFTEVPLIAGNTPVSYRPQTNHEQQMKYPPYPDIWDWHEPSIWPGSIGDLQLYIMPNGDALIEYQKKSEKDKKLEKYAALFFERKTFAGDDADRIIAYARDYLRKLKEGKWKGRFDFDYLEWKGESAAISLDGIWDISGMNRYDQHCYGGPNRYPYMLANKKTGQERIFTIFRILDKPESFYVHGLYGQTGTKDEGKKFPDAACLDQERRKFNYQVDSVLGNFVFLNDNSILFQVVWGEGLNAKDYGMIIRFGTDLKSKSNVVGNHLFLVDNKEDLSVIGELTGGKQFEDDDLLDAKTKKLYDYLLNIKKKRRK